EIKSPEEVGPAPPLGLAAAVELSLLQNPDLIALRQNEGIGVAAVNVARKYPFNTFVKTQYFPSSRDADGRTEKPSYYIWLMQTLELAHQRRFREQTAEAALNTIRWNVHQAELVNMAQTQRLYCTALYQRELRDLVRETADVNERLAGVLERRFQA